MERWIIYAICSMFFAGATAVLAKAGLAGISSELGLLVRTLFVAVLWRYSAFGPSAARSSES
jgi:transporter family protein